MRPTHELLYDSEASLRLVDRAIGDLSPSAAERGSDKHPAAEPLDDGHGDDFDLSDDADENERTAAIVVRFCQRAGMLDAQGSDALKHMPSRLREVTARTETATTDILDGLGRAVALVNLLDRSGDLSEAAKHEMMVSLRDELNIVSHHLQFQDITAQQLADVAALFADMRSRIAQVVSIFAPPTATPPHVDPVLANDQAQALADEIFSVRGALKSA